MSQGGLPHSEISGSKPVCGSPKLFAAYHVLHRLLAPRHSPYALSSLTIRNSKLTLIGFGLWTCGLGHCLKPRAQSLQPACVSSMHTACVWSENYRLQSIQLSKSCRPPSPRRRRTTFASLFAGLPTVARFAWSLWQTKRLEREGWWRIPGSNR